VTAAAVAAFVILLAVAVVVSIAAERVRVPAAVMLVVVGVVAGTLWHVQAPFAFGPALLFVFLPPLIFEAAWTIDLDELRASVGRVALLAFPGTLMTAFAIAAVLAALRQLPFAPALLFGAIVSATDPLAVVAVFRRVGVPAGVRTLIEAESLANDGVAVILYGIALLLAQGVAVSLGGELVHGVVAAIGGVAIGVAVALVVGVVLRTTGDAQHEVAATFAQAYIAYLAADRLGWSGIFATAASAIALRALLHRRSVLLQNVDAVDQSWSAVAFVANAAVFVATGLTIDAPRIAHEPVTIGLAVLVVLAPRAVLALLIVPDRARRITVFLAGMRGGLPLALALSLPASLPSRAVLIDAVFATVLATLVVQGLPLAPVVRALYGTPPPQPTE
jgi:CPA1 family monovalent cation:H+ antiporter